MCINMDVMCVVIPSVHSLAEQDNVNTYIRDCISVIEERLVLETVDMDIGDKSVFVVIEGWTYCQGVYHYLVPPHIL